LIAVREIGLQPNKSGSQRDYSPLATHRLNRSAGAVCRSNSFELGIQDGLNNEVMIFVGSFAFQPQGAVALPVIQVVLNLRVPVAVPITVSAWAKGPLLKKVSYEGLTGNALHTNFNGTCEGAEAF
jgi:hypothetical protein